MATKKKKSTSPDPTPPADSKAENPTPKTKPVKPSPKTSDEKKSVPTTVPTPPPLPELFFATGNPKKLEEIQQILKGKFQVKSFDDLEDKLEVEETEDNLKGNALLKAKAYFEKVNIPTFADDTGLFVAALDGAPGVFSARYAGPEADASKNSAKLMAELKSKPDRSAAFKTVIAYVDGKTEKYFEGSLMGEISILAAGDNGFGYDPIFLPKGNEKTLAELKDTEKNKISHRAKALKKFSDYLLK